MRPVKISELRRVSCPEKFIESAGAAVASWHGKAIPWTWDGSVPWDSGSAPLVCVKSALCCATAGFGPRGDPCNGTSAVPAFDVRWFDPGGFAASGRRGMTRPEGTSPQVKGASRGGSRGVPGSNLTQRPVDDAVDRAVDIAVDNFVD